MMNRNLGIACTDETEDDADQYAGNALIPEEAYDDFIMRTHKFTDMNIRRFSDEIDRDPGIVPGRLMMDGLVPFSAALSRKLRCIFRAEIS